VIFKNSDDSWGNPIRFGPEINTKHGELCAFVSRDNNYLFFSRNDDIYWVDAKIIEKLRLHIKR